MKRSRFKRKGEKWRVTKDGRVILGPMDYRNHKRLVWFSQHGRCAECALPVGFSESEFHHEIGRGMGGGKRNDLDPENRVLCKACHRAVTPGPEWKKP